MCLRYVSEFSVLNSFVGITSRGIFHNTHCIVKESEDFVSAIGGGLESGLSHPPALVVLHKFFHTGRRQECLLALLCVQVDMARIVDLNNVVYKVNAECHEN